MKLKGLGVSSPAALRAAMRSARALTVTTSLPGAALAATCGRAALPDAPAALAACASAFAARASS